MQAKTHQPDWISHYIVLADGREVPVARKREWAGSATQQHKIRLARGERTE